MFHVGENKRENIFISRKNVKIEGIETTEMVFVYRREHGER
ncbi:hypothetical protein ES705_28417 [subsurface metagenome]